MTLYWSRTRSLQTVACAHLFSEADGKKTARVLLHIEARTHILAMERLLIATPLLSCKASRVTRKK